jgi:hypothetical protein
MIDTDTGPFALVPLWLPAALYARRPKAGGTAIVVYVAMHRWTSGDDRTCHPSVRLIADEARVSVTACKEALKLLRDVGAVTWRQRRDEHGDLTSSDYTIHTARPRLVAQATDGSGGQATDGLVAQATSNQTQCEPDPPEPDTDTASAALDALWGIWPTDTKGKGSKADALAKLRRMKPVERAAAVDGARRHAAVMLAEPGRYAMPHVVTWLNKGRWTDDLPLERPQVAGTRQNPYLELLRNEEPDHDQDRDHDAARLPRGGVPEHAVASDSEGPDRRVAHRPGG